MRDGRAWPRRFIASNKGEIQSSSTLVPCQGTCLVHPMRPQLTVTVALWWQRIMQQSGIDSGDRPAMCPKVGLAPGSVGSKPGPFCTFLNVFGPKVSSKDHDEHALSIKSLLHDDLVTILDSSSLASHHRRQPPARTTVHHAPDRFRCQPRRDPTAEAARRYCFVFRPGIELSDVETRRCQIADPVLVVILCSLARRTCVCPKEGAANRGCGEGWALCRCLTRQILGHVPPPTPMLEPFCHTISLADVRNRLI